MKTSIKILLLFSFLISPLLFADQKLMSFKHDDQQRHYVIYRPASYSSDKSMPLLMVLHGRTGDGKRIADITSFNQRAEQHGFIVVYPDGNNHQWNYLFGVPGAREGSNDPDFLAALTKDISTQFNIDPRQRYVTGLSNGGFMAQRLACDYDNLFAGFASVAASGYAVLPENCNRRKLADVLYMHGTADSLVPWEGLGVRTESGDEQLVTLSIKKSLKFWSNHNKCSTNVEAQDLKTRGQSPGTSVRLFINNECEGGTTVALFAIIGGGHNWPGVNGIIPPNISGKVNMDIHASDVIWSFFSRNHSPQ